MQVTLSRRKTNNYKTNQYNGNFKIIKILSSIFAVAILINIAFYNYVESFFNTILEAQVSRKKVIVMLTPLEQVDKLFKDAESKNLFTGAVLFAKDGNVLYENAYGYADKNIGKKNTTNTKFPIASLTKAFTSAGILKLNEEGLLSLDDPVTKFIPEFKQGRQITIRQLLNHQSGIWNYPNNETKAPLPIKKADLIKLVINKQLMFKPGYRFMYSNSNYILLSAVIEKASGISYENYIKTKILDPLELKDTGFISSPAVALNLLFNIYELTEYTKDDLAKGYEYDSDSKSLRDAEYIHASHVWGAGSMYSTLRDLYKWDESLYTNKVLTYESLEQIFTPDKNKYGLGWNITTSTVNLDTKVLVWHQGLIAGYNSFIYRYPEDHATIIILKNLENSTTNITDQAIKLFWASLYN